VEAERRLVSAIELAAKNSAAAGETTVEAHTRASRPQDPHAAPESAMWAVSDTMVVRYKAVEPLSASEVETALQRSKEESSGEMRLLAECVLPEASGGLHAANSATQVCCYYLLPLRWLKGGEKIPTCAAPHLIEW